MFPRGWKGEKIKTGFTTKAGGEQQTKNKSSELTKCS